MLTAVLFTSCVPKTSSAVDSIPAWLKGEWRGIGYQINLPQAWAIELKVASSPISVHVNYPSLECSAVWTLVNRTGDRLEFREEILVGADRCINGGVVIITRVDQHHISYSFFEPQNKKLEAFSTLVDLEYEASKKI